MSQFTMPAEFGYSKLLSTGSTVLQANREPIITGAEYLEGGPVVLTPLRVPPGQDLLRVCVTARVVEYEVGPAGFPKVKGSHRNTVEYRHLKPGRNFMDLIVLSDKVTRCKEAGNTLAVFSRGASTVAPLL